MGKISSDNKTEVIREFKKIPGVGNSIAEDLWNLGYRSIHELKNENPEKMYIKSCRLAGQKIDRCLLYVYRCAVYFASNKSYDSEMLKWWNWKDNNLNK